MNPRRLEKGIWIIRFNYSEGEEARGEWGGGERNNLPPWMTAASRVDFDGDTNMSRSDASASPSSPSHRRSSSSDPDMGFGERALSAAGAAFLSAILMNPLDVAKTRLQAQAAGVPYHPSQPQYGRQIASLCPNMILSDIRCSPSCACGGILGTEAACPPDCFQYKGTLDVFCKVVRQEGFARWWRGTNAGLALAVPTVGIYLPCFDIFRNWIEEFTTCNAPNLTPYPNLTTCNLAPDAAEKSDLKASGKAGNPGLTTYAPLVAGSLARALACITCSPIELARTRMQAYKEFQNGAKSQECGKHYWAFYHLTGVRVIIKTCKN